MLVCGNDGSAADAQHFAAELVGRFKLTARTELPAFALNTDTSVLTALSNDLGSETDFARQVESFGNDLDVLICLSTSGRSKNLIRALEVARERGIHTIALLGGNGGDMEELVDLSLIVPSADTQRIQEVHILLLHLICELVEERMMSQRLLRPSPVSIYTNDLFAVHNKRAVAK